MTTSVKDFLAKNTARYAENRRDITAAWDELAVMLEDGRITEAQFGWLLRQEPDDVDTADSLVVALWARQLRRALAEPGSISADLEAFVCTCICADTGWVTLEDGKTKPCQRCNPRQYARWLAHWSDPDHSCADCSGAPGKRRTLAEERAEAGEGHRTETLSELI